MKFTLLSALSFVMVSCSAVAQNAQEKPVSETTGLLEPTFDSIRSQILEMKCVLCHSPGGKAQRIPLLTREDLLNSPLELVIPGNPEESMLMIVLQPDARKPMPPKSSGISPLTSEQVDTVGQWILNGAKD